VNKAELVEFVKKSGAAGDTGAGAERAVNAVFEAIEKGLKKDKNVALVGFGNFVVRDRKARVGRNPKTGEQIKIPASKTVVFKCGKAFKEAL
jgi:DNA-binding protein HU-beta